ncbi:hypothetical protein JCM3770_003004 [Rhodotorula araucariae]
MSDLSEDSPSSEQGSLYSLASAGPPSGVSLPSDQGSSEMPAPAARGRRKHARKPPPGRPSKAAVCDHCRRRKIQCDLQTPCRACVLHGSVCEYSGVDPAVRLERLLAFEAADVEYAHALFSARPVDALKSRLNLSEDQLHELYETANERMLAEKAEFDKHRLRSKPALAAAHPLATWGTRLPAPMTEPQLPDGPVAERLRSLKRSRWPDEGEDQDEVDSASEMPPPPSAAAVREVQAHVHGRPSTRRRSLMRVLSEEAMPPPPRRAQEPSVPPLPPSDPTGRPYPAAPYHFPHTYPMPPPVPMLNPPAWMAPLFARRVDALAATRQEGWHGSRW